MRHTLAVLRVLAVLPFPPLPEGNAAARCAIGLLSGLQEQGLDLRVLASDGGAADLSGLPEHLPIEIVPLELPTRSEARVERLLRPKSALSRGVFAARLRELAGDADVVHLVGAELASSLASIDRPAVVQLDFLTRRDRRIAGPWTREGRIALELLRVEARARRTARWLLANSEEVARALRSTRSAQVWVSPLALDPRYYEPSAALDTQVAGLIGMARWPPTKHAVERLLRSVWPLVRRDVPEARLMLAGYDMEASRFRALPGVDGVEWCGKIDSATDFLRRLGVLVYPLPAGSGAKIKVLEALALGVPVVTTPDGAEGLGGGAGVIVEHDDSAIATATAKLLTDEAARRAAGADARRTFMEHHSPAVAAARTIDLYEHMAR